jgi:hypothetical protein
MQTVRFCEWRSYVFQLAGIARLATETCALPLDMEPC